jgi:GNAT superfamily N-acetyltransferase
MTRGARVTVRAAGPGDVETIVGMRLALLASYDGHTLYGRLRPDAAERARRQEMARVGTPREVVLLAHAGTTCIGMLRCADVSGSPLLDPARYGYVSSAFVLPAHRRRGVLRALLAAAEDWCGERGITEMRLHHVPESESASRTWEALGFEVREVMRTRTLEPRARRETG